MALARTRSRIARAEKSLGVRCPVCAGRLQLPAVVFRYGGRLTDGRGRDIDPASLEPCRACGRGRDGAAKVIVGVDPACI